MIDINRDKIMLNHLTFVVLLLLNTTVFVKFADSQQQFPSAIVVCRRNDTMPLSQCVKQSIERLRPSLKTGNYGQGFRVDGIDPLTIDDIIVRRQVFQADLRKMVVTGASTFIIEKIKVDFDNPLIDILVRIPRVQANGFYSNTFNILGLLNSRVKGIIKNTLENMKMRLTFKGHREVRNGRTYIKFDKFDVKVKITKIRIRLENAFPDKALNDAINAFVNQNTELFLPEAEAAIKQTFTRRMRATILKVFDNYPLDVVYP